MDTLSTERQSTVVCHLASLGWCTGPIRRSLANTGLRTILIKLLVYLPEHSYSVESAQSATIIANRQELRTGDEELEMPLALSELKSTLWEAANILRGSAVDRTDWKGYSIETCSRRICVPVD